MERKKEYKRKSLKDSKDRNGKLFLLFYFLVIIALITLGIITGGFGFIPTFLVAVMYSKTIIVAGIAAASVCFIFALSYIKQRIEKLFFNRLCCIKKIRNLVLIHFRSSEGCESLIKKEQEKLSRFPWFFGRVLGAFCQEQRADYIKKCEEKAMVGSSVISSIKQKLYNDIDKLLIITGRLVKLGESLDQSIIALHSENIKVARYFLLPNRGFVYDFININIVFRIKCWFSMRSQNGFFVRLDYLNFLYSLREEFLKEPDFEKANKILKLYELSCKSFTGCKHNLDKNIKLCRQKKYLLSKYIQKYPNSKLYDNIRKELQHVVYREYEAKVTTSSFYRFYFSFFNISYKERSYNNNYRYMEKVLFDRLNRKVLEKISPSIKGINQVQSNLESLEKSATIWSFYKRKIYCIDSSKQNISFFERCFNFLFGKYKDVIKYEADLLLLKSVTRLAVQDSNKDNAYIYKKKIDSIFATLEKDYEKYMYQKNRFSLRNIFLSAEKKLEHNKKMFFKFKKEKFFEIVLLKNDSESVRVYMENVALMRLDIVKKKFKNDEYTDLSNLKGLLDNKKFRDSQTHRNKKYWENLLSKKFIAKESLTDNDRKALSLVKKSKYYMEKDFEVDLKRDAFYPLMICSVALGLVLQFTFLVLFPPAVTMIISLWGLSSNTRVRGYSGRLNKVYGLIFIIGLTSFILGLLNVLFPFAVPAALSIISILMGIAGVISLVTWVYRGASRSIKSKNIMHPTLVSMIDLYKESVKSCKENIAELIKCNGKSNFFNFLEQKFENEYEFREYCKELLGDLDVGSEKDINKCIEIIFELKNKGFNDFGKALFENIGNKTLVKLFIQMREKYHERGYIAQTEEDPLYKLFDNYINLNDRLEYLEMLCDDQVNLIRTIKNPFDKHIEYKFLCRNCELIVNSCEDGQLDDQSAKSLLVPFLKAKAYENNHGNRNILFLCVNIPVVVLSLFVMAAGSVAVLSSPYILPVVFSFMISGAVIYSIAHIVEKVRGTNGYFHTKPEDPGNYIKETKSKLKAKKLVDINDLDVGSTPAEEKCTMEEASLNINSASLVFRNRRLSSSPLKSQGQRFRNRERVHRGNINNVVRRRDR